MPTMKEELARLEQCRKARQAEFSRFVASSEIQTILAKFIGFFAEKDASEVTLHISTGADSFTDGKNITVGMFDNFFSPEYGPADWAAIFKALLAHEMQHRNSSNFSDMGEIGKDFSEYMKLKFGLPETLTFSIAKTFLNIMEDSRIENIIIHKMPGFGLVFRLMNGEIRRLLGPEAQADTPAKELADFQNNCLSYAITGCLAPNMSVYAGTRLEKEFQAVKHFFDAAVDARTSSDCRVLCEKMLHMCGDYIADLLKDKDAQEEYKNAAENSIDEYTSNQEVEFNEPSPSKSSESDKGSSSSTSAEDDSKESEGKGAGKEDGSGEEDSKEASSSGKPRGKQGQNALRRHQKDNRLDPDEDWTDDFTNGDPTKFDIDSVTPEELARIRRGIRDEFESIKEGTGGAGPVRDRKLEEITKIYKGEHIRRFQETFPTVPTESLPADLSAQAKKLEQTLERILRMKRSERRNIRTGRLSPRDLYRVGVKDPLIFMRKGRPVSADMAVFMLLDNSGSMNSCGATVEKKSYSKSSLSRVAAAVIEKALSRFAKIKITLFDVSGVVRHVTLKKFDETPKENRCYNSINHVGVGEGNKDGYSIRVATKELMERREPMKVLIDLSDGLPSDYNEGEEAGMNDVRLAVKEAKKKGIIVIPILFGDATFRAAKASCYEYMYEKYISSEPADIIDQLGRLFVSLIEKS